MKIKNTRNIGYDNLKKKDVLFSDKEQEKFNLKDKYTIISNFHGAIKYEHYNIELTLEVDHEDYDKSHKFTIKVQPPTDVHDNKDKDWKIDAKVISQELEDKKVYSAYHDNKDRILDKLVYSIYKQAVILLETEIRDDIDLEESEEEEVVDENTYKDQRFSEIYSPVKDSIGDVLTNDDLKKDVKMMAKYLGHEDKLDELERIKFDGRLKRSSGNISYLRCGENGQKRNYQTLKINSNIPNNNEGIEEYFNTIKHELAHLISRAGDGEIDFIKFCRKENIGQSHSLSFEHRYNYFLVCHECNSTLKKQVNMTKNLKEIEEHAHCGGCGNEDLEILDKEDYQNWK